MRNVAGVLVILLKARFVVVAFDVSMTGFQLTGIPARKYHDPYSTSMALYASLSDRNDDTVYLNDSDFGGTTNPKTFVPSKPSIGFIEQIADYISDAIRNSDTNSASKSDGAARSYETSYSGSLTDLRIMDREVLAVQLKSLVRVLFPAFLWTSVSVVLYPYLALFLAELENDQAVFSVLSQDASQFVQNILTTSGLMFSILVGYTYYFMYQQQQQTFLYLFAEVSEAKSLLEQISLVCAGRPIYQKALAHLSRYIAEDLKQVNTIDPAVLLSRRPVDDPLEGLMYLTSVGTPSAVYDTIKSLREARANRLGALQRKLPELHSLVLKTLGTVVLVTFPVCGSGSQIIGGHPLLVVQSVYFGIMVFGMGLVLGVIDELWKPRGGAYNVDGVLSIMVRGLEEELEARRSGRLGGPHGAMQKGTDYYFLDDLKELQPTLTNGTMQQMLEITKLESTKDQVEIDLALDNGSVQTTTIKEISANSIIKRRWRFWRRAK